MKLKNRILASVLAFIIGFGFVGVSAFSELLSIASSQNYSITETSSNVLVVKNVDKTYSVGSDNNVLRFWDYCETAGASVMVFSPDRNENDPSWHSFNSSSTYSFAAPGMYAMQFRIDANVGSNYDVYSDVIYIPVGSEDVDNILLDGEFVSCVAPNTVVTCPSPINEDGSADALVGDPKVYGPNGEEIEASKSSVTNKWTFTNKSGLLGVYYVEYTKTVYVAGRAKTCYKYEKIEFSSDTANTTALKESKNEETTAEPKLVVTGLAVQKDEKFYLFKNYDLSKAYVTKNDGSTNDEAVIYVSIFDEDTQKYFNFSNGLFDLDNNSSASAKKAASEITDSFAIKDVSKKDKKITITYTSEVGGKTLTETISKDIAFNMEVVKIAASQLPQSFITDILIVEKVEDPVELGSVSFRKVDFSVDEEYDFDSIKALITDVILTVAPISGVTIDSNDTVGDNGVGIIYTGPQTGATIDEMLNRDFTYKYNRKMTKTGSINVIYSVNFGDLGAKTVEYKIYVRESELDSSAPVIEIGSYNSVVTSGNFVVPSVTVKDTDDAGNATVGAKTTVTLSGGSFLNKPVSIGETLDGLQDGIYTLKFEAVDTSSKANKMAKTITFIVNTEAVASAPSLVMGTNQIEKNEETGELTVTVSGSNAQYVTIYTEDGQHSPSNIVFENGNLKSYTFKPEDGTNGFIVIYAVTGIDHKVFGAIVVNNGIWSSKINSFGYSKVTEGYVSITPGVAKEAYVNDQLLWFGSNTYSIECPENGYYTILSGNIIKFLVAGTYVIKSSEVQEVNGVKNVVKQETKITIKNEQTEITTYQPIGNKLVGKKNVAVELNIPIVTNFFGYEMELVIKDSCGNVVDLNSAIINDGTSLKFVPSADDVYSINYIYRADGITKGIAIVKLVTGSIARPKLSLTSANKNVVWEGVDIRYYISGANATDKNGNAISVVVTVFDKYGKQLTVKSENGVKYVDLKGAGFYAVQYSATDADGYTTVLNSTFAVEFPMEEENNGISAWGVVGIVLGSIVLAGAIALLVVYLIKQNKNKQKFINKNKQNKKKEKTQAIENTKVYTISQSKDEKYWTLKSGNRSLGKFTSKVEAIEKVNEVHKKGEQVIKVYNKNGRLIDSI